MTGVEIIKSLEIISKFKDSLVKGLKLTLDEINTFFGKGLEEYLDVQHKKYAYTKTFLYRDAPIDFYAIFYPISIRLGVKTLASHCN